MKSCAIPELIDPSKGCDKKLTYHGVIVAGQLPRFSALQCDQAKADAPVNVSIAFKRDDDKQALAEVEFQTLAKLVCQRCLQVLEFEISGTATLMFCKDNDEVKRAPKRYEPVLVEADKINLWQIVEDELLLSLPMYVAHTNVNCNRYLEELKQANAEESTTNPFAVLSDLLNK